MTTFAYRFSARMLVPATLVAAAALASCMSTTPDTAGSDSANAPKVCRADNYQKFIGKNRSELPTTPADENWRVVCSTCAVTMDYREDRLTIAYDTQTNLIQSARCG